MFLRMFGAMMLLFIAAVGHTLLPDAWRHDPFFAICMGGMMAIGASYGIWLLIVGED